MICEIVDLGDFEYCSNVTLPDAFNFEDITITNIGTRWECTFIDNEIGELAVGQYQFTYEDEFFIFNVI